MDEKITIEKIARMRHEAMRMKRGGHELERLKKIEGFIKKSKS